MNKSTGDTLADFIADAFHTVLKVAPLMRQGESYCGRVDEDGVPAYYLVLLPSLAVGADYETALSAARGIGGALPTPAEIPFLRQSAPNMFSFSGVPRNLISSPFYWTAKAGPNAEQAEVYGAAPGDHRIADLTERHSVLFVRRIPVTTDTTTTAMPLAASSHLH